MIGKKIKQYLSDNGLKQNYVAAKLGYNPKTFNQTLNGNRKLSAEEARDIAIYLNLDAGYFLKGE